MMMKLPPKAPATATNEHSSTGTVRFNGKLNADPVLTESQKAVKLSYTTDKGKESTAHLPVSRVQKSSNLTNLVETAKAGQDIILEFEKTETGGIGNLKTVTKGRLEKAAPTANFSGGKPNTFQQRPYVDNTVGLIKGNAVTNAVQLAIAQKDTSDLNLRKQLQAVLRLHGFAESLDIKKEMLGGKGNKIVATEEDTNEDEDEPLQNDVM